MDIQTLDQLLHWLFESGGGVILVAWAAAWGLEGLGFWEQLSGRVKSLSILGLSVILGLLSVWVHGWPAERLALVEPYARAVIACVAVWLTTQTGHKLNQALRNSSSGRNRFSAGLRS